MPQPVACTTSTRALGSHSAATAVSWSSRNRAASPAIAEITPAAVAPRASDSFNASPMPKTLDARTPIPLAPDPRLWKTR
ncbi:hypothetical protein GCM10028799_46060 [Kribbella italica]